MNIVSCYATHLIWSFRLFHRPLVCEFSFIGIIPSRDVQSRCIKQRRVFLPMSDSLLVVSGIDRWVVVVSNPPLVGVLLFAQTPLCPHRARPCTCLFEPACVFVCALRVNAWVHEIAVLTANRFLILQLHQIPIWNVIVWITDFFTTSNGWEAWIDMSQ